MMKLSLIGAAALFLFSTAYADDPCTNLSGQWAGKENLNTAGGKYTCNYQNNLTVIADGQNVLMSGTYSNGSSPNPGVVCQSGDISFTGRCFNGTIEVTWNQGGLPMQGGIVGNTFIISGSQSGGSITINDTKQSVNPLSLMGL
jgi:hypothetical protein